MRSTPADAPPDIPVQIAESLLDRLGATGAMAQRLARYPSSPRLSRIVVEAIERGVGEDGCAAAAPRPLGSACARREEDLLPRFRLPTKITACGSM